jgi:hypothetical protein
MVCKNTQVVPSTTSIVYKKKEENSTSLSTLSTQNSTSFLCAQNTRATMSSIVRKICWCGEENHIDKCQIHGSQPFYHDEGGSVSNSWEIYRCERCEEVQDSFACEGHTPYDNYFETLPIRAMVVLANVLIQDSVNGKGITGVSTPDDSFFDSSINGEMNNINSSDKTVQTHGRPNAECVRQHIQDVTKAGSVGNDGKIQHTLNIGVSTPNDSFFDSSNNGEMLNTQYSQQELDAIDQYQTEQQCLKLLADVPEEVTESIVIISTDKACTKCGAIHEEVSIKLAQCTQCGKNSLREMDDKMARNNIHDGVSTESLSFMYIEAFQALGTMSIEDGIGQLHKINPYVSESGHDKQVLIKSKAPCPVPRDIVIDSYLISNGAKKTDDQKMLAEINSQICNLANCLNSDIPMLKNYARKIFRLIGTDEISNEEWYDRAEWWIKSKHHTREVKVDTDEVSLIPESKSFHKAVAVNMYNKIIREYGHYTEGVYPDTPDHMSVKALGSNTWSFQLATKVKKDGKWIPRESVDISAIMNILKGFQMATSEFPTVELIPQSGYDDSIQSEIIMFGDVNTKMTWVPTGKRSGSPAHLTEYYEEDKMRNKSFQHFNMDELVNQSELENNSKIDNGTDGVFEGDIIPSRWYDMVVGFSIDTGVANGNYEVKVAN